MSGPVRIFVTGLDPAQADLCGALAGQPGIELAGSAAHVGAATRELATGIDALLHSIGSGPLRRGDLEAIRSVTHAPIVLLVDQADTALLDEALDAGVADVVLPQAPERIAFALRKAARTAALYAPVLTGNGNRPRAKVITVFSPKGGTGKTVISSNLASSLAKDQGARTLLVDLDVQFGDAAIMLGLEPERTLHELATAPGDLDGEKFHGYLTPHAASGADVLAAPLRPENGELVTERTVERLLEVARSAYDAIVVDTSPSFHGPMLAALDRTDVLLLVCTPEVPTLKNVRLGIETLRRLSFPEDRLQLVLNRADPGVGMRRDEVEVALDVPVRFELPRALEVPESVNSGTPLALSTPLANFSRGVRELSKALAAGATAGGATWSDRYRVEPGRTGLGDAVRGLTAGLLPVRGTA